MLNLSIPASRLFVFMTLLIGVMASILFSIWSIAIDDVINNDGIVYIEAAEFWSRGDWQGALGVYKWPFYPWLIMVFSDTLGISFKTAGHVLNTTFFSLVVVFFVQTVHAFGGRSRMAIIIAMLIALLHPAFNEYRAFLIRDPGYLAAYLLGIYSLVCYRWSLRLRYSFFAILSFLIASLFRVEGLVFLFAVPILLLASYSGPTKWLWLRYIFSLSLILVLGCVLGGWFIVTEDGPVGLLLTQDPLAVFVEGWSQIRIGIDEKLLIFEEQFLGPYSTGYAYLLFMFTAVKVILSSIVFELEIPYLVLMGYGLYSHSLVKDQRLKRLWTSFIVINLGILTVFVLIMLFLAPRYPLAMTITILIAAPLILEKLISDIRHQQIKKTGKIFLILLAIWALGESYSGLSNFTRAGHLRDAGYWLYDKTEKTSGPILTNNRKIAFYASQKGSREVLTINSGTQVAEITNLVKELGCDFAGIRIRRDDILLESELTRVIKRQPISVIENEHGDRVLLYDLRD